MLLALSAISLKKIGYHVANGRRFSKFSISGDLKETRQC